MTLFLHYFFPSWPGWDGTYSSQSDFKLYFAKGTDSEKQVSFGEWKGALQAAGVFCCTNRQVRSVLMVRARVSRGWVAEHSMGFRGHFTFWIYERGVMNLSYSCPWSGGGKQPLIFMTDMIRCLSTSTPHPRDCALKPFCSWKPGHLLPSFKKCGDCIFSHQNRYY